MSCPGAQISDSNLILISSVVSEPIQRKQSKVSCFISVDDRKFALQLNFKSFNSETT